MLEDKRRVLFVGGLPSRVNEAAVQRYFERFSPIEKVRIVRERDSRESKGYAFVTFESLHMLPFVLEQEHYILGRKIDCQPAARKSEKKTWMDEQKSRRIFVVNLPLEVDNQKLNEKFSEFGQIRNAYVICDFKTKVSRTYGIVEFFLPESAAAALSTEVWIGGNRVLCHSYSSKEDIQNLKQYSAVLSSLKNGMLNLQSSSGNSTNDHLFEPYTVADSTGYISRSHNQGEEKSPTGSRNTETVASVANLDPSSPLAACKTKYSTIRYTASTAIKSSTSMKYEFLNVNGKLNESATNYRLNRELHLHQN